MSILFLLGGNDTPGDRKTIFLESNDIGIRSEVIKKYNEVVLIVKDTDANELITRIDYPDSKKETQNKAIKEAKRYLM